MVRIGIIGAGKNGTGNAKGLAAHPGRCRITAVADPVAPLASALAAEHSARACADPAELVDHVDAVVISSPNFLHAEHAVAMAEAGKHVWIEKPMALSPADADRIVQAVDRAGVVSFVGFAIRYDGVVRKMKELVRQGALGDLVSLFSRRLTYLSGIEATWRGEYAKSGGVISELLSHEIDWIVDIAGAPSAVHCRTASRRHDDPRANDHVWLTMTFADETTGTIEGSQMAFCSDYYRGVMGTAGSATTRNWGGEVWLQTEPKSATKVAPLDKFDKFVHFLDAVEGTCASAADVHYGRLIVSITDRALQSAVSGSVVNV